MVTFQCIYSHLQKPPLYMSSSSSPIEQIDRGYWTVGFIRQGPGLGIAFELSEGLSACLYVHHADSHGFRGKIRNRKAAGLDELPPEVWKTRQFDDILLQHCNAINNQNPIDRWMKGCILPVPKKGDLRIANNNRGLPITSITAKIYNALLCNCIEPKIENKLRKNQNGFWRNRSTTSQILTIRPNLQGLRAKKTTHYNIFCRLYILNIWKDIHFSKTLCTQCIYG